MKLNPPDYVLAVCTDKKMLPAACCVLFWGAKKTSIPLHLVLVGVGLDTEDRESIEEFQTANDVMIRVADYDQRLIGAHDLQRFGLAALTRLSLDLVLDGPCKRVLYLDSDIFIADDLAELFRLDLEGKTLAASYDISKKGPVFQEMRRRALGLGETATYFTSAVLLFDWTNDRPRKLLTGARRALQIGSNFKFPDQDAINVAANGDYKPLPQRWHVEPHMWRLIPNFGILHFSGRIKPWSEDAPIMLSRIRQEFARPLLQTRWHSFVKPLNAWRIDNLWKSLEYFLRMRKKERLVIQHYGREVVMSDRAHTLVARGN